MLPLLDDDAAAAANATATALAITLMDRARRLRVSFQ